MPDYTVTITKTFAVTARNDEQADERASDLEALLDGVNPPWRWKYEAIDSDFKVERDS